jgi:hypothetical protein
LRELHPSDEGSPQQQQHHHSHHIIPIPLGVKLELKEMMEMVGTESGVGTNRGHHASFRERERERDGVCGWLFGWWLFHYVTTNILLFYSLLLGSFWRLFRIVDWSVPLLPLTSPFASGLSLSLSYICTENFERSRSIFSVIGSLSVAGRGGSREGVPSLP